MARGQRRAGVGGWGQESRDGARSERGHEPGDVVNCPWTQSRESGGGQQEEEEEGKAGELHRARPHLSGWEQLAQQKKGQHMAKLNLP